MTIELDRDIVRYKLRIELERQLRIWRYRGVREDTEMASLITEIMFDVAATTQRKGPEAGILQGLNMIKNWHAFPSV